MSRCPLKHNLRMSILTSREIVPINPKNTSVRVLDKPWIIFIANLKWRHFYQAAVSIKKKKVIYLFASVALICLLYLRTIFF